MREKVRSENVMEEARCKGEACRIAYEKRDNIKMDPKGTACNDVH
jgi:hypothetical protein